MTNAGVIPTQLTTPTARHVSVFIGWQDVTGDLIMPGFTVTDAAGDGAQGQISGVLNKPLSSLPQLYQNAFAYVMDHDLGKEIFHGFLKSYKPTLSPTWSPTTIVANDHNELLDTYIPGPESRPAGESDQARIGYLWGLYAGPYLSGDLTFVQAVTASLPAQTFEGVTLRRALDMTAAQASSTARWHLDQAGRLHYYTSETNAAPFNINADAPGAGERAPEDLEIDNDAMNYRNAVFVNGATPAGSGWVLDRAAIARNGGQEVTDTLDAPDCTTAAMRDSLGAAFLARVTAAQQRIRFSTTSPDDGWMAQQTLTVVSAKAAYNATQRIVKVTTTFMSSAIRRYSVECGAPWRGVRTGATMTTGNGSGVIKPRR